MTFPVRRVPSLRASAVGPSVIFSRRACGPRAVLQKLPELLARGLYIKVGACTLPRSFAETACERRIIEDSLDGLGQRRRVQTVNHQTAAVLAEVPCDVRVLRRVHDDGPPRGEVLARLEGRARPYDYRVGRLEGEREKEHVGLLLYGGHLARGHMTVDDDRPF